MPTVTFNGQSFSLDARRLWILGAGLEYARIPAATWAERLSAVRQAGFNTVMTACPWSLHEPRRGRYDFEGDANVREFLGLCDDAGLWVILRPGPFVGSGFDAGGLPGWLLEDENVVPREANAAYLERVGRYQRKIMGEVADLQATKGGRVIAVQIEQSWTCDNPEQAEKYLGDLARIARETGISVPLLNANNLWTDPVNTIDTWTGGQDLLANLRQLRAVRPEAPRIVTIRSDQPAAVWGGPTPEVPPAGRLVEQIAETLAAGAQPIVSPFHGGTHFGFSGGRLPGPDGGTVTTTAAARAPLGEAGARGARYEEIRPLVTFADQFAHVFSDLEPDHHPVCLDPKDHTGGKTIAVAPLRGAGGQVVFLFGGAKQTTLLLEDGIRLPVPLDAGRVHWVVFSVDLRGSGRLDYANLSPFAIVDRSIVVLSGPERAEALLSVNGTPFATTVPSGAKPRVVEHKGLTFVICSSKQIDATYVDEERVYVGVSGFELDGSPRPAAGWPKAFAVGREGKIETLTLGGAGGRRTAKSAKLSDWRAAPATAYADGSSPRYASLDGPGTLPACGAPFGYGWYRLKLKSSAAKKRTVHIPQAGDRLHLYMNGEASTIVGDGPGSTGGPIEMKLDKGEQVLTVLADNFGRSADGNDLRRPVGLYGHLYTVKTLRTTKGKVIETAPIDPFAVRGFIIGAATGTGSDATQVEWSFNHLKKTPVLVDIDGPAAHGTIVLNDVPLTRFDGALGAPRLRLLLVPSEVEAFKRGKNVLRFAPDLGQDQPTAGFAAATRFYECIENLSAGATWSFAKWEPPTAARFKPLAKDGPKRLGVPSWWTCRFEVDPDAGPWWFDTTGLSKGQVILNGRSMGRYFTATATGAAVGPQTRLLLPSARMKTDGPNELIVFDEHGFVPTRTKLVVSESGELD